MGSLRIIAGTLKGRRIRVPEADTVRPTPDRAREALFSILGDRVAGARVLDVYAGTGALGLEALSRGAASVTFLEADRRVLEALSASIRSLGVSELCFPVLGRAGDDLECIKKKAPFDLILADPPYADPADASFLGWLSGLRLGAPGVVVVLEREASRSPADPGDSGFCRVRSVRYGRTALDFYREPAQNA